MLIITTGPLGVLEYESVDSSTAGSEANSSCSNISVTLRVATLTVSLNFSVSTLEFMSMINSFSLGLVVSSV